MVKTTPFDHAIRRSGTAVLLACSIALSCSPAETAPAPRHRAVKKAPAVPRAGDCRAFEDLAAGTGTLKLCNGSSTNTPQACPASDEIVVLIDNDYESAARRTGRDVTATNWQNLLLDIEAIGRTECTGGDRPLERLPGRCGTIQDAVRAWRPAACRNPEGQLFPRFLSAGSGRTTPATEAVHGITRAMTRPDRAPGIVFMAFDGIVDGDYRNAAARLAFADAVADAVTAGLKVWIIVSPADYRYIYVFARAPFEEFAGKAAAALGATLESRNESRVVTAFLSEAGFLDAAARADVAHVAIGRASIAGAQWEFDGLTLRSRQHPPEVAGDMWKVNISRWLSATAPGGNAYGALLRLSWDADPSRWDALVPFGVRLPPPRVLVNRPVHSTGAANANPAWIHAAAVEIGTLEGCAPRTVNAPVAQGVSIAPGQADFLVIRGATAGAKWLNQPAPWWPGGPGSLKAGLAASAGPPLMAAALVAQPPRLSHCTEALLKEFAGSHTWGSGRTTPELTAARAEPDCQSHPWPALIDGLQNVPYRRFRPGAATPWSPTDGRVAVETFLTVVETVARRLVQTRIVAAESSCVLATLQFESGTTAQSSPAWTPERFQ